MKMMMSWRGNRWSKSLWRLGEDDDGKTDDNDSGSGYDSDRDGDNQLGEKMIKAFMTIRNEPAEKDEENTVDLMITADMDLDAVVAEIMKNI